jgi:hypothetical protein
MENTMDRRSRYILAPVTGLLIISQTACTSLTGEGLFVGEDEGRFLLSADRAGMEAFGDSLNGVISNSRIDPNTESAHWQLRKEQTRARLFRVQKPKSAKGGQ